MEQKEKEILEYETVTIDIHEKSYRNWDQVLEEIKEIIKKRISQNKMAEDPYNKINRFWLYLWPDEKKEEKIIIWFGQLTEELKIKFDETFPDPLFFRRFDKR